MVGPGAGVCPQTRVHSLLREKVREVSKNDAKSDCDGTKKNKISRKRRKVAKREDSTEDHKDGS